MLKKVAIYTDGACSGNPGVGGYGAVLIYGEHEKRISGAVENTTNNRMELLAMIMAFRCLKELCEVDIYSDSAYIVDAFNLGRLGRWMDNGWRKPDGTPVKNKDLWEELASYAFEKHRVYFNKVKGHADNEYNNICDKLAVDAIKNYKSKHNII